MGLEVHGPNIKKYSACCRWPRPGRNLTNSRGAQTGTGLQSARLNFVAVHKITQKFICRSLQNPPSAPITGAKPISSHSVNGQTSGNSEFRGSVVPFCNLLEKRKSVSHPLPLNKRGRRWPLQNSTVFTGIHHKVDQRCDAQQQRRRRKTLPIPLVSGEMLRQSGR